MKTKLSLLLLVSSLLGTLLGCDDEAPTPAPMRMTDMGMMMDDANMPSPAASGDLNVLSGDIRSCDIVLTSDTLSLVGRVQFKENVQGVVQERLPKTALAFIAKSNESITGEIATLTLSDSEWSQVSLARSVCYDQLGQVVEGDVISLKSTP
jgi:hypothetical protein